jgi:hypothetical protein
MILKMNKGSKNLTLLDVLGALRDTTGHDILSSIAGNRMNNLKMSRKQYYLRLSRLIKANMIKRENGKYLLTTFGKVVYMVQLEFVKAIDEHFESKSHNK